MIDPKKLETIRRQWREKSLLLNPSKKKAPSDTKAPDDARYFSDRNIRVEKEQRARNRDVIPKPGAQTPANPQKAPKRPTEKPKNRAPVSLKNLALPFRFEKRFAPPEPPTTFSPAQARADQDVLEKDLPTGSENLLNAQESVYYSFFARMYETIGPIWNSLIRRTAQQRTSHPGDYTTVLDVVLDQTGKLVDIRVVSSSRILAYDEAAIESWKRVGRFPNPPKGLLDERGEIHTGWTYRLEIGQGGPFNSRPPERNY